MLEGEFQHILGANAYDVVIWGGGEIVEQRRWNRMLRRITEEEVSGVEEVGEMSDLDGFSLTVLDGDGFRVL